MIKIYTDSNYLTEKHRKNIFPLLLGVYFKPNEKLAQHFCIVPELNDAKIAIVPVGSSYYYSNRKVAQLHQFIESAKNAGKIVWLYSDGDFGKTVQKNVYTFRLGGFHSKLDTKTFILPSFIQDPYKILEAEFCPLEKADLPAIGFVGNADGSTAKYLKEAAIYAKQQLQRIFGIRHDDKQEFFPSSIIRHRILRAFERENRIQTDFIFRKKYRGGAVSESQRKATTLEFFENMKRNPYVFCLRGSGNFSVRFFETLAMGRIPVVVDTDIRLPLHETINWEQHCIIVSEKNCITRLISFNENVDPNRFRAMQEGNRKLWLNLLSREGYFISIADQFLKDS